MKNIILFIFVFFSVSCQFDASDEKVCCFTPYKYTLSLVFSEKSDEANDVLLGDKVDDDNVYFYYLKNQEKIKIPTDNYSGYLGKTDLFFIIYSESSDIYEPFADKGLTTIYLQKRNNKIDTLQINISKEIVKRGTRYIMNQIKINGENAKEFPNYDDGYRYWLKTP